ncbi:MAG: diaminopimelate decarboxylase [Acidimicrobiales bacterium]
MIDPGELETATGPIPSEAPIGRHLLPDSAEFARSGELVVGGIELAALAAEFGTPLFVYDVATIRARCREAMRAFGGRVVYASKAFTCKAIVEIVLEEGLNIDVSTGGELAVAIAAGAPGARIVLHGNNKSDEELNTAIKRRVSRIVVDSFDEIVRIERAVDASRPGSVSVLVRVNPGIEAHTHDFVATGRLDSKFGFPLASGVAERALDVLRRLPGVDVVGLHAHIGSQIFRVDSFERLVQSLKELIERFELAELSVGGGLAVAYLTDEVAPSITQWADAVLGAGRAAGLPGSVGISAEPGRAIVATAAITCYRIGTIKQIPGVRTYVAVDGGMSDNPRPVLYGSGYEAFLPRASNAARPLACRVVGKHCESGDILVADARLPGDIEVGDVLATPVTGAYGVSMASNYNRIPRPAVVFVEDGVARAVLRRETPDDLLRLEV